MRWLLHLATRTKLLLGFGLLILLLALVILEAGTSIRSLQKAQRHLLDRDYALAVGMKDIRSNQNGINADAFEMIASTDRAARDRLKEDIEARIREIDETIYRLDTLVGDDPVLRPRLAEFVAIRGIFAKAMQQEVIPLIVAGKTGEAAGLLLGIQHERNQQMRLAADRLLDGIDKTAQAGLERTEQQANNIVRLLVVLGIASLLLAAAAALYLNRIIADPLRGLSAVAGQIALGDLSARVPATDRRDEVGALSNAFGRMTQYLSDLAGIAGRISAGDLTVTVGSQSSNDVLGNSIAAMVENLRRTTRETREAVNILASSSSEILASMTQLSSSTSETSTAMSQTTTTVEEVKQTAQLSTQKSKDISDAAQEAARVLQTGRKYVEESTEGMRRIKAQMESIGESTVQLSEQSQSIGEITATVNDIAEQSNLLAVNASIEAAKAGEYGKGFGVVAQEIKSLSEQSKQATGQVRDILADVQKAISSAVMATEQAGRAVDAGVKQTGQTAEAIGSAVEAASRVAQASTQIVASSSQQLIGTDQVAAAMENIKQASLQNVDSMKQVESAVSNLHELGQKLKEMVEQFRV